MGAPEEGQVENLVLYLHVIPARLFVSPGCMWLSTQHLVTILLEQRLVLLKVWYPVKGYCCWRRADKQFQSYPQSQAVLFKSRSHSSGSVEEHQYLSEFYVVYIKEEI